MKRERWEGYADAELLRKVTVRLIRAEEKARWDELIEQRHYLKSAHLVGRQLRYVAELNGQWVALLGWSSAAYHLKWREQWIGWSVEQRSKRLKFVVQNSRFLLLSERSQCPNLASRVLSLCTRRLQADWRAAFGYGVLVAETFVDPDQYAGTSYRAAGWQPMGPTQGYRRHHRDFYQADGKPKELWLVALQPRARQWLSSEQMPTDWAQHEDRALSCPYRAKQLRSLWEHMAAVSDPRAPQGVRHCLPTLLTICALATLCGARGTRAIAEFAGYLNERQLRRLGCRRRKSTGRFVAPSEPTIRRVLKLVPAAEVDRAAIEWMAGQQKQPGQQVAVDGKAVKSARQPDERALHLVAAVECASNRLLAQRPVEEKSNEITALRPMLEPLALDGKLVSSDAMQAQQQGARFL